MIINAQTIINNSVSLTGNSNLTSISTNQYLEHNNGNCNILNGEITINGDLNLNGYILYIKQNTNLQINGNINGGGEIKKCNNGNNNSSISICVTGNIQNSPNLNGLVCNPTLSVPIFDLNLNLGYPYSIYNLTTGQILKKGLTSIDMYYDIPKQIFLVIDVEGFERIKTILY